MLRRFLVHLFIFAGFAIPYTHAADRQTSTQSLTATSSKEVALTFDDGPYGTSTQQILDILQKEQVPATFFLIGKNVAEFPSEAREEVMLGYELGNHTYDHTKHLTSMSPAQVNDELGRTDAIIASTTGIHTRLFRPPYGRITAQQRKALTKRGYTIVMWNVDPRDWDMTHASSTTIVTRTLDTLKPLMIIVLHDGRDTHVNYSRDNLINALPTLIQDLKEQGYTFVTADKLASRIGR